MLELENWFARLLAPTLLILVPRPALGATTLVVGTEAVSNTVDGSVLNECGTQVAIAAPRNWAYNRGYRDGDFGIRCALDPVHVAPENGGNVYVSSNTT